MKKSLTLFSLLLLFGCNTRDRYDVARYYNQQEQDEVLTQILTYIFDAPPLTPMKDRFKPVHHFFYSNLTPRFSIARYYIAADGTHFFYVIRPTPNAAEKRGVGGHFKMKDKFKLTDFREEFVTPILPVADVKGRCAFMFDEMVKGNLEKYLSMESYVQWPNPVSYYDSTTYEWKLKPDFEIQK